jgi:hypothetical protein
MSTPPPAWPPQPGVPSPYGAPQSSSNATLILVLGILSIFFFQIILGPIAWILGNNALKSGAVDPAQMSQINTGRICGIIGTVLGLLILVTYIVVFSTVGLAALHHPGGFSPPPAPAPTSSP